MAYGSISVKTTRPVSDINIVGYNDFLVMTLRALRCDSVARKEMTEFIAMQHSTILERVAEFLGTDMPVFGTIGKPLSSCNAGIAFLEKALFDIHVRSCYQVWSGLPWHEEHLVAHCNATYLLVLSWKSTGNSWEDALGFVKLLGLHNRQFAGFCARFFSRR